MSKVINASPDAAGMLTWVQNTLNLYEVYRVVEPMKKAVEEMSIK